MGINMKKIIVFEGLDGAGKSTLLDSFEKTNPEYLKMYSVPDSLAATRKVIDKTEEPLAALHFFGLCNIVRSKEIKNLLAEGKRIVMDRYVFSTLAYQYQMLGEQVMNWFELMFTPPSLILPDLVVFVTARQKVINSRIKLRDAQNAEINKTEWYGDEISKEKGNSLRKSYKLFLEKSGVTWFEFNTSDYSKEEQIISLNKKIQDL